MEEMALGVRQVWVIFLVTLGKGPPSSGPQFPHLSNGNANTCPQGCLACRGLRRVPAHASDPGAAWHFHPGFRSVWCSCVTRSWGGPGWGDLALLPFRFWESFELGDDSSHETWMA